MLTKKSVNPFDCFKKFTILGNHPTSLLLTKLWEQFDHLNKSSSILLELLSLFKKPFIEKLYVWWQQNVLMRELIMFWCFYDKENILILFRTPSIEKKNASHANDSPFQRWQQPSLIATHSHTITINFIIISYLYRTCDTTRMIKYAI